LANQPFFPSREGDQILWFSNIQTKVANYYTTLDISTGRQTKLTLTLNWLIWAWQVYAPTRRPEGPAATKWRNDLATGPLDPAASAAPPVPTALTPPTGTPYFGMLTWLFEEIARWKAAEGYTETIGKDLGVIGAEATPHTTPPELTQGTLALNSVELRFVLHEHDGVWIECQRQGDAGFSPVGSDTASPWTDTRPVKVPGTPEWRDYRACWWDNSTPSMQFGPVLRVIVNG
jgi:hypothetical protein